MSVNKLLAKALSTSSDEEALSAFHMARKRYAGESINVTSTDKRITHDEAAQLLNELAAARKARDSMSIVIADYQRVADRFARDNRKLRKRIEQQKINTVIVVLVIATISAAMGAML